MIGISIQFPAGRYHATPWGRHVNEGIPEWPPSHWRLLRTLIYNWKIKNSDIEKIKVKNLIKTLMPAPNYKLPVATTGHTRHYMRWYKKGPEDQTLVFDTFVSINKNENITLIWPGSTLDEINKGILIRLLENLSYLGRAESWCEARLLDESELQNIEPNCYPLNEQSYGEDMELVRVLCADPETAFDDTHVKREGKKSKRPEYDPAWHLCIETSQLHEERWSDPPGSKWVKYVRKKDCFEPKIKQKRIFKRRKTMQVARYAIDSTVLPLITETLPVAEKVRIALMGIYGRFTQLPDGTKGRSVIFSGKDQESNPLQGHGHAYYLPTDEDEDGRLDHLTIVALDGFNANEIKAIDHLRRLKLGEDRAPVDLLLLGLGCIDEFQPFPLKQSREWISATPFIVTRHLKKKGRKRDPKELHERPIDFVLTVLKEELQRWLDRNFIADINIDQIIIEPIVDSNDVFRIPIDRTQLQRFENSRTFEGRIPFGFNIQPPRPLQFKRYRQKRNDDGGNRHSGSFRIIFPKPVSGPICLGHSSHFGMGLFLPKPD